MRITNSLFYQNSKNDYQKSMQGLYGINSQISSRMKIQNSYEDSGIFVDTMRLNYEVSTLEQIKESSSKAQTFANNTDTTLNQFTDALSQFKTKMIQASSEVHSQTSLNALANELEALKTHMISLANTSINGQFLFSGSSLSVKPISSDGSYNGNDQSLETIIGSGVQIPYNIDGNYLFQGADSDYNRVVSTNVIMYNQSKLHPDIMVLNSGETSSQEVYLTENDTIRDMVGDTDNVATNDPNAVFHVSGKRPDGTTFTSAIEMSSDEKVSELLEKIGEEFGNTPTNTVVEVSMNEHGQIEIKDLKTGNQQLQFHIVGAVDRTATSGSEGDADSTELVAKNVQIIDFLKSDFAAANTASTISSRQDIYAPGQFSLGAPMYQNNGEFVTESTKLRSFMGDEVNQIQFNGVDNAGNTINPIAPNDVLRIDDNTTVSSLLSSIENAYGVSARLENGQIYVETGSTTDFSANKLQINLEAFQFIGDGEVQSIDITAPVTADGNITLTLPNASTVNIAVLNGDTQADVASKIEAASAALIASDPSIASIRADGDKVYFDYLQSAGAVSEVAINPNATGVSATVLEEAPYLASGLGEVQSFEIKEAPSVNGSFTLTNIVSPANDIVVNFNAGDTPSVVAAAIQAAVGAAVPFTDANGKDITSVSVSNGMVTFNYDSTDGNVPLAPIVISQTAGVDDLVITNANDRTITQGAGISTVNAFTTFDSVNLSNYNFTKDGNTLESNVSQVTKSNEFATASTKLSEVSGSSSLDGRVITFDFTDKNGNPSKGQINLKETTGSTFQIDFDNSGTYEDNETINLYAPNGSVSKASEVTYQQVMDVITLALSGKQPLDKDTLDTTVDPAVFDTIADGNLFEEYQSALKIAKSNVDVHLDSKGVLVVTDLKNTETNMQLSIGDYDITDLTNTTQAFSFMANDAIKINDPSIDFFSDLDDIIESVRFGEYQMDSSNENPRSLGLNNGLTMIDHLMDHVTKAQTTIGSYSNALSSAQERAELLSINVQTVRSSVIDVDLAEAYLQFEQLATSYQAMLSTASKINSMSLLNYM